MSDEDIVKMVAIWFFSVFFAVFVTIGVVDKEGSHRYLGSKGGPCFPNMTCRENLRCIEFDGLKPTCIKIGTMKLPPINLN
jgi:hypothetical protein